MPRKRSLTNQILFLQRANYYQFFIPAYLRLTFKKITEINVKETTSAMIATAVLTLYYRHLPPHLKTDITTNMVLSVGEEHILLNQNLNKTKMTEMQQQFTITFTYRDVFKLQMSNSVFLVPFDVQTLTMVMHVRTIESTQPFRGKKCMLRFNLMDNPNEILKFSINKLDDMGEFGLAGNLIKTKYGSELSEEDMKTATAPSKVNKVFPFHVGTFTLGIYRYPTNTLLMIFIPLWLLTLINLAIFFQPKMIKDRIANITTLMVAYTAFLPVIRNRIPSSSTITLIQLTTYCLLSTTVLCLVQSLVFAISNSEDVFFWFKSTIYIVCLGVTVLSMMLIGSLILVHKFVWEPRYLEMPAGSQVAFASEEWSNKECDMYFEDLKPYLRSMSELKE